MISHPKSCLDLTPDFTPESLLGFHPRYHTRKLAWISHTIPQLKTWILKPKCAHVRTRPRDFRTSFGIRGELKTSAIGSVVRVSHVWRDKWTALSGSLSEWSTLKRASDLLEFMFRDSGFALRVSGAVFRCACVRSRV